MKAAVITWLVLASLSIVVKLIQLGRGDYPRTVTWTSGEDAGSLVIDAGIVVWLAYLLVGATHA